MKHPFYFSMLLVSASLLFCSFVANAQVELQWDKTFGREYSNNFRSVINTPDGGYLLAGTVESTEAQHTIETYYVYDYRIIKVDAEGNQQWEKIFDKSGGPPSATSDILNDVITTADGGFLLAGTTFVNNICYDNDPSQNFCSENWDFWIIKLDADGNKLWDKTYGGDYDDQFNSIVEMPDGGYLLAGSFEYDFSGGDSDYSFIKIDASGNQQWDNMLGSDGYDRLTSAIATPDGGYLLGGYSNSNASGDKTEDNKGEWDFWIIKLDADGNKLWDKTFGGNSDERLNSIIATDDGDYLLGGHSDSNVSGDKSENSRGNADYWIIKVDNSGNKQWDKTIGGDGYDRLETIVRTSNGGYLLAGNSRSSASGDKSEDNTGAWLVKIDADGNKLWDKTVEGGSISSAIATADGGYLMGGSGSWAVKVVETEETEKDFFIDYLTLMNAKTDMLAYGRPLPLQDGDVIDLAEAGTDHLSIWANTEPINVDSVKFVLSGPINHTQVESAWPYASFGDKPSKAGNRNRDFQGMDFKTGAYSLIVTPYYQGQTGKAYKVNFTVVNNVAIEHLALVNADTDKTLYQLQDGDKIDLSAIGNPQLTIQANTKPANADSVKLQLSGPITHTQVERYRPFALFGDKSSSTGWDYMGKQWKPGEYTLTASPYLGGKAGRAVSISFQVVDGASAAVSFFVLVNTDTDEDISIIREGDVIDLSALGHPQLSIRANTTPINVDKVELALEGPITHTQTENFWPYALFGDLPDSPRDYIGRAWQPGNYTLTATPYLNNKKGVTTTISFSVTNSSNARLAVEVYPVPTTGEITVSHEGTAEKAQMMLLDYAGNVVLEQPLSKQDQQLDLSSYRKGIYYLKVVDSEGVHLKRVVVE